MIPPKKLLERMPNTWLLVVTVCCVLSLLAEFSYEKHPHVHYEKWFGFFGLAALGATIGLVLLGLLLRPLLWRDQEYYDG